MKSMIAMADAGTENFGRPPSTSPAVEQEQIASVSILSQILMLGLASVLGHILRRFKLYYLHEASASHVVGNGSTSRRSFSFCFYCHQILYTFTLSCCLHVSQLTNISLSWSCHILELL